MPAMKSYLYSSPAVQPFTGNDDYGSPRVSAGRRPSMAPSGPGMSQPYGNAFDSYNAPQSQRFSGGGQQSPMMFGGQQQQPPPMSFNQQQDRINHGNDARMPSNDSTLGRTRRFASDPIAGAIVARMPGNEKYADILGAGMAPQLQSNQMGAINVQNAQAMAPFYPQMAQQQVRGATIQNNSAESVQPFLPQQAQADVGKTNAEAGAITKGADAGVGQMKQIQDELRRHQVENQALRQQLAKYQQQEQKQQATANKPVAAQKPLAVTDSENAAAAKVGYGGVMAMRQGKAPGDPTTQPSYQPPQQQQPAQQQQQPAPATQPVGQIQPDGSGIDPFGNRYIQDPGTGNWHKVKQPTSGPTTQPAR